MSSMNIKQEKLDLDLPSVKDEELLLSESEVDFKEEVTAEEKWFECDKCPFKTRTIDALNNHLKKHDPSYWFQCDHCSHKCYRKVDLKLHIMAKHTDPKDINWLECPQCDFKAKNRRILRLHLRKHNESNYLYCLHCSYKSHRKRDFEQHVLRRHTDPEDINWLQCEKCPYKAKTKDHLNQHIKHKHTVKKKPKLEEMNWLSCGQCNFKTKNKQVLTQHLKKHDESKWLHCVHCSYKSHQKYYLEQHILCRHTDPKDIVWLPCEQCPYKAKSKDHLNKHVKNTHMKKNKNEISWLHCQHCRFKTISEDGLNDHVISCHEDLSWLQCPHCPYQAKIEYYLSKHLEQHTKDEIQTEFVKVEEVASGKNPFPEVFIKEENPQIRDVQNEYETEKTSGDFICKHCLHKSTNILNIKRHIIFTHTDSKNTALILCPLCPEIIQNKELLEHWNKHENKIKQNLKNLLLNERS